MKLRHCNQLKKCLPITCTISISLKKLNEETRKSRDDTVFREIKTVLSPFFLRSVSFLQKIIYYCRIYQKQGFCNKRGQNISSSVGFTKSRTFATIVVKTAQIYSVVTIYPKIKRSVKIHQTTQFRLNNLKTLLQYQGTLNPNQSRNRYLFSSSKEKLVILM